MDKIGVVDASKKDENFDRNDSKNDVIKIEDIYDYTEYQILQKQLEFLEV